MADFTLAEMQGIVKNRTESVIGAFGAQPKGQAQKMIDQYKEAYKDIDGTLEKAYAKLAGIDPADAGYYNELIKTQRLQNLQDQIKTLYNDAAKRAGFLQIESSKTAINNVYYGNMYSVNWFSGAQKLEYFAVLNPNVVKVSVLSTPKIWENIRENHPEQIKNLAKYQPKHGTLIETLTANRNKDIAKINSTITQSLLKGDSYQTLSKDIKNIMNGSANQAMRIARTEGIRNMNAGALANTQAAIDSDIDVGREVVEVMDTRTRDQSASINGQKQKGADPFHYPGGLLVEIIGNSGVASYDINERGSSVDYLEGIDANTTRGINPATGRHGNANMRDFNKWMKQNDLVYSDTGRITSRGRTAFGNQTASDLPPVKPKATEIKFVPAKTVDEAIGRLNNHFNKVDLPGLRLDPLNSLLHGAEEVLGKHDIKVDVLEYQVKKSRSFGRAITPMRGRDGVTSIQIQKSFLNNPIPKVEKSRIAFTTNKANAKGLSERILKRENTGAVYKDQVRKRLDILNSTERWGVYQSSDDPIRSVIVHEAYHMVDRIKDLEKLDFRTLPIKDIYNVSEYAASNSAELFAEIGSAITRGVEIPQSMIDAFNNVMEGKK